MIPQVRSRLFQLVLTEEADGLNAVAKVFPKLLHGLRARKAASHRDDGDVGVRRFRSAAGQPAPWEASPCAIWMVSVAERVNMSGQCPNRRVLKKRDRGQLNIK